MNHRKPRDLTRLMLWLSVSLILCAVGVSAFIYIRWRQRESRFNVLIAEVASVHGVDRCLVKAIIKRESKFDPFARGDAGEIGLMQVTHDAGQEWAQATRRPAYQNNWLWDPRLNIEAGTWYLSEGLRRWKDRDDPVVFALAYYNGGPGNVRRWVGTNSTMTAEELLAAMDRPSVRDYVRTVQRFHATYRQRESGN
jgi:soluble lytic murein transglycosylase